MGTLVPITPKSVSTQGFQLQVAQDMFDALNYLSGLQSRPYSGSVNRRPGGSTWFLVLADHDGISYTAEMNDWIILKNGVEATVCAAAAYPTFYTTG